MNDCGEKVKAIFDKLSGLKEDDEKIILPFKWE
jgi:hypothetical protein